MKNYFYGIYGIEFIWHGEWADPELVWHKKSFNYYDVENTFWEIWKGSTEYLTANLSTEMSMEDSFAQWMKKNAKRVKEFLQYLMDNKIFYGGLEE